MLSARNSYTISEVTIEATDTVKDLGVIMTSTLSLEANTRAKVAKANQLLGIIRRSFHHLTEDTLVLLFKTMIRPHLEFCNTVTHPTTERDMTLIEGVQRRATKMLAHLRDLPYEERLRRLKLPSMKYRFLRGDLIALYKYTFKGAKPAPRGIMKSDSITRGHSQKIDKPRCRTSLKQRSFPHRSVDAWNKLPDEVVTAPSTDAFKARLDRHFAEQLFQH